jgi:hypothetical protein
MKFIRYGICYFHERLGKIVWVASGKGISEDVAEAYLWTNPKLVEKAFEMHSHRSTYIWDEKNSKHTRVKTKKPQASIVTFEVTHLL